MSQSHTRQPLSSVRGRPENSLLQERTHAEWFSHSKCLKLEIKKFRCYEAKIEESEKGRQLPGVEPRTPGLNLQCSATELWQPHNHHQPSQSSIIMYCTGGTECLSRTPGSHSVWAVRTLLGVDRKILSFRKEPMLRGFLTLNAQSILP